MSALENDHASYNLHLHTHWSDDATTHPRRYFERARALGVRCIAITDHHVLDSLTDAHRQALLESYRPEKTIYVQGYTHVKNQAPRRYFLERGFIAAEDEYAGLVDRFQDLVPFPPYPRVEDVVPVVKRAGALVAIAHPHGYFAGHDLARMDALSDECDLNGIECVHPSVPFEYAQLYRKCCQRYAFFSVGGSDCHTGVDVGCAFALHRGADEWLGEFLECLQAR